MADDFSTFFQIATGDYKPYPFQEKFATDANLPHLLRAPTGAGKTATAILGWLYRWHTRPAETPRRLVYCLPMRVLVEQSEGEARKWVENLRKKYPTLDVDVHVLMGGMDTEEWYLHPEKPAILIGTQDMLLSRALNRGYAASRFHWPIDFGLLNNDCLWVFDEPQLMANGVSTSAQLAGLRSDLMTFGACPSVWMSATLEPAWLDTIDFRGKFIAPPLELGDADYDPKRPLNKRMTATKILSKLDAVSSKDMAAVAKEIHSKHIAKTQTLVVVNTVERAKAVYAELGKLLKKSTTPALMLIHSRFRPHERQKLNESLQSKDMADRIIVATQVVEAGVDISSRTLFTELAPWSSIVQRIGRCNRTGDDGPGRVFWIELPESLSPPYEIEDLKISLKYLIKLENRGVSPRELDEFKVKEGITLPYVHKHVLRKRDLIDLFDTAPDLSGNDIDVARFVRGDDPDTDVQVFWRDLKAADWDDAPERRELCRVPIGGIKPFLQKNKVDGYLWDHLDDKWRPIGDLNREIRPGLVILLPTNAGGYSELGWAPESKVAVMPLLPEKKVKEEATDSDANSAIPVALAIWQHTDNVCREMDDLLADMSRLVPDWSATLKQAARWHDVGKALRVCQQAMHDAEIPDESLLLAKSGRRGKLDYKKYGRNHFRHELGSALAALQNQFPFATAYLIGTHHGKLRLSIRSLPDENEPKNPDTLFALGVHGGDELPETDLGGEISPKITLDLTPMQFGGERSWTANALKLLNEIGPFKLSFLETLLRAADVRASKKEARNV